MAMTGGGILVEKTLWNDGGNPEVFRCEVLWRRSPGDPRAVDSAEGGRQERLKKRKTKVTMP